MMRADSAHPALKNQEPSSLHSLSEDEALLSSFDPMIEGSSFQVFDPEVDENIGSAFNLAESLAQIPEKLFFRIGEVADLLEVKAYVLRFWETEFPMVHPTKSRSGQRVYRKKDVEMLFLIKHLLYVERFSIEGARKRIRELKMKPAAVANQLAVPVPPVHVVATPVSALAKSTVKELVRSTKEFASVPLTKFFRF